MINVHFPQQTILGLSVLVIVSFCMTAGYVLWQWKADFALAHQQLTAKPVSAQLQVSDMNIADLPKNHLFGQSLVKSGQIPITSLQLRVTGIVKMESEQGTTSSKAYISIADQPGKIYQIGDILPYGVKVFDITADAVMLENNGRLEKLPLPREQLKFKSRSRKERL